MSREAWIAIAVGVVLIGIVTLYGAVRLLRKLFHLRRHLGDLGGGGKFAFWGSLIYTIFPVDLLPDPIYLDDMAVVGAALAYLTHLWHKKHGKHTPLPTGRPTVTVARPKATTRR